MERNVVTEHGAKMTLLENGWVCLIRESVDEDGSPMTIWFYVREDDLMEFAAALHERRSA